MTDTRQDTYLSEAEKALQTLDLFSDMHPLSLREGLQLAEPFFAKHYEQKERGKVTTLAAQLETQVETTRELQRQLLAAEQKGAEGERGRLEARIREHAEWLEDFLARVTEWTGSDEDELAEAVDALGAIHTALNEDAALSEKETDQPGEGK